MPKVGMEEIRKTQLIEATIALIHEEGFTNASISKISKRAGLSSGIVAHYFDDKSGLLTATLQHLMRQLGEETSIRLAKAKTPIERLLAVVYSNFAHDQFKPGVVDVWLAFWALVPTSPELARLHRINERRMHSNFQHALKPLLPASMVRSTATGLAAMVEGLWIRCALTAGGVTPKEAISIMESYINSQILVFQDTTGKTSATTGRLLTE
ncbi:choline-binding transcriptional repressor BetI [Kiloniella laminariae]|uniref:choline-binding transcriptional repressor BetI n=1 Tax=Kiloniella laminariae TaxID=454162 RepID=UPI0003A344BC|nr:transcriptional regulator BetI [Kiloniella laminariae]